jgi:hypothetical protein
MNFTETVQIFNMVDGLKISSMHACRFGWGQKLILFVLTQLLHRLLIAVQINDSTAISHSLMGSIYRYSAKVALVL